MKSKNKIMDSFEQFIAEHVSVLKNRIIQITDFRSDFVSSKSIDVELSDNLVRINCINNESAYNLLTTVLYKRKLNKQKKLAENEDKKRKIPLELA